jgi:hypothetical protein
MHHSPPSPTDLPTTPWTRLTPWVPAEKPRERNQTTAVHAVLNALLCAQQKGEGRL